MALNPLVAIAGPESSNGANLYNPASSATGIWQDLQGTWASTLPNIGVSPSLYPTAASAPASVQAAANAYLYNTQGFAPWAPYDPTLASNIAAAGGASAYAAPGTLSTNPADYASLDQPGGLANFFSSQGSSTPSLFPGGWGGFGADAGSASAAVAPYTGYTYDPTTGTMTPYSGTGSASGTAAPATAASQSWWQTLVAGVTAEFERVGIIGFGAILVVAAAFVLMWPHTKGAVRAAGAALA